jgi:hypothetical protein
MHPPFLRNAPRWRKSLRQGKAPRAVGEACRSIDSLQILVETNCNMSFKLSSKIQIATSCCQSPTLKAYLLR